MPYAICNWIKENWRSESLWGYLLIGIITAIYLPVSLFSSVGIYHEYKGFRSYYTISEKKVDEMPTLTTCLLSPATLKHECDSYKFQKNYNINYITHYHSPQNFT